MKEILINTNYQEKDKKINKNTIENKNSPRFELDSSIISVEVPVEELISDDNPELKPKHIEKVNIYVMFLHIYGIYSNIYNHYK